MSDNARQPQTWYFTFGLDHARKKHVQPIHAPDANAARLKMLATYGQKWADQHDGTEFAAVDQKYGPYSFLPAMDVTDEEATSIAAQMEVPR